MDALGNLYGTTYTGFGFTQIGGTVFELSQSGGQWTETLLYGFSQHGITPWGPRAPVVLDATGNLYGTTYLGGAFTFGAVYEIKR